MHDLLGEERSVPVLEGDKWCMDVWFLCTADKVRCFTVRSPRKPELFDAAHRVAVGVMIARCSALLDAGDLIVPDSDQ